MGQDAADWQRQVTVNVSSVGQIPVDITKQTLSRLLVTPDERWVTYEREKISNNTIAVAGTTEVSLGTYSGAGVGFALRVKVDYAPLVFRIYTNSVLLVTQNIYDIWNNWGGGYYEDSKEARVIIWDEVNDIYSYVKDYGWLYPFSASCEIRVYNPHGSTHNVNSIVMAFLKPV
jgi:hypothetical protein